VRARARVCGRSLWLQGLVVDRMMEVVMDEKLVSVVLNIIFLCYSNIYNKVSLENLLDIVC